jgi:small-conductance mechanosensitive channel
VVKLIDKHLFPVLYYGAFYLATRNLVLGDKLDDIIAKLWIILFSLTAIRFIIMVLKYWLHNHWLQREKNKPKESLIKGVIPAATFLIWAIGIVFLLENLGIKVSTIVAGLGIGGIAVALAAQAVLGDMFSYFSIILDRPFEVGDFIILNEFMGTVEYIGIKTTRIRSLSGEQLIFPNSDLTGARIRNYKRMQTRRIVFQFGVTYSTSLENLKRIPEIVREICDDIDEIELDRVHFFRYGPSSLDYEVVYIVQVPDYNAYMDVQQRINLYLFERFRKIGVEFAFPTQTVYLKNEGKTK